MSLFRKSREFVFPGPADRVAIVGSTGAGKTVFAFWLFSESADFDKKPWIIVDYKGETLADQLIERGDAKRMKLDEPLPTKPGIYIVKPRPREPRAMADYLWNIYERGKTGLLFDELSMVPEFKGEAGGGGPLKSILTQGRSKIIPVYGLVQRPVDVNLHTFSEAQFISEFYLKKKADRERVDEYLPDGNPVFEKRKLLPDHWSRWWDDRRRVALILRPAPGPDFLLDTITNRIDRMRAKQKL